MKPYCPQKIYLEKSAEDYALTRNILARLPDVPVERIENAAVLAKSLAGRPDPIGEGKRYLVLRRDPGRAFKPFPQSEDYLSCDYFTLHVAEGCDLECSYCILQAYLTNPFLTVYVNVEEMLARLQEILDADPERMFRIGTGQLADSLSLDPVTGLSNILIPFFARQKNAVLELKTKSHFVDDLLELDHNGRTIISWSVNSPKIMREEEHKCAPLEERLAAARRAADAGYRCGFHFDPIVDYPGWKKDYAETAAAIAETLRPEEIAWISMGGLRFMPALKSIMQERFPKSGLPLGEWISGMDGKMRYPKSRRIEIYRKMTEILRDSIGLGHSTSMPALYLCMESPEVWRQVFGAEHDRASVCGLLDRAAYPLSHFEAQPRNPRF